MSRNADRSDTLTYGQVAAGGNIFRFLRWLVLESITLPQTDEGRSGLAVRWIKHEEHEKFVELMAEILQKRNAVIRARIKNGVRPYGGRSFPLLELKTYPNGRKVAVLKVGSKGHMGINSADERHYSLDEIDLIEGRRR